jgi:hypothetical protein
VERSTKHRSRTVVRHFSAVLTENTTRHAVLVAVVAGRLVGTVEVVRNPDPPDHQILRPEPSAQIHTVVADDVRNQGIGSAFRVRSLRSRVAADHGGDHVVSAAVSP